jgi:hypothetical protein
MTESFVHHPRFAVTARTGLTAAGALSFQPGTLRGPALLVPVDLQALVVPPGATVEHADMRTRLFDQFVAGGQARRPQPFAPDLAPRSPGVRLHWALPDGLTQARSTGSDGRPAWRALPDRWAVLRVLPEAVSEQRKRPVTGWVIESERRRTTDLDAWRPGPPVAAHPPPATPHLEPADLHVMTGGDPIWAACFDDVEDRFAFHDQWDGLAAPPLGPVAYLVVGWYSRPELDPLARLGTGEGFHDRLAELGWSADTSRILELQRAAEDEVAAVRSVGLDARTSPVRQVLDLSSVLPAAAPVAAAARPWWPQRCVFHGVAYGVRVDDAPEDRRPDAREVRVSLGPAPEQAVAALLADGAGDPNLEALLAAFTHGLTDTLGEPDGLAQVEAELHTAGFDGMPGGEQTERVLAGDPFADVRPPPPTPATARLLHDTANPGPEQTIRLEFMPGGSRVADLHTAMHTPGRAAAPPEPRTVSEVVRAAPRWFAPRDPSFVVRGLQRNLRHGYDGRFDPGETLPCRLSGDTVSKLFGFVDGRELLARDIGNAALPEEAEALLVELAIEDPFAGLGQLMEQYGSIFGYSYTQLMAALQAESRVFRWWLADRDVAAPLLGLSFKDGVGAAPLGITIWRQAWVPLYLEWELDLDVGAPTAEWPLGEHDFEPPATAAFTPGAGRHLHGRSLLTSANARALAGSIRAFLATEDQLDLGGTGRIPEDVEQRLRALSESAGRADLLTAGIEGLRDLLLGFTDDTARGAFGASTPVRLPGKPPEPTRAGFGRLERLRVVDAFGRTLTLVDQAVPAPILARPLRPTAGGSDAVPTGMAGVAAFAPRLNQPSRLLLRFVDRLDDHREARVDQTAQSGAEGPVPVAGWLLPDQADGALEVFSPSGEPLGQLAHDALSGAVVWEGTPGDRVPLGTPPETALIDPGLRHLLGLVQGLLARDAAERASAGAAARSDTPLEALLRTVETTGATVGLGGHTGTEHMAQLLGRPIAVVRAVLRLEVQPERPMPGLSAAAQTVRDETWMALRAQEFAVRLGALTRLDDGLLGFFVDGDYGRLVPVHEAVTAAAVPIGRHRGDYADPREAPPTDPVPIISGYLADTSTIWLRPGRTVALTLLQDPAAKVHATSGVLPRKDVSLVRDWVEGPLARLTPSFRIGPVLVDPAGIRMPPAAALGARQEWGRRDGPTTWRHDPIAAATQQALLPETAAVAEEGYLRAATEPEGGAGP